MRLYLASSVFRCENYDFLRTIEAAAREGFRGVQLYLDREKAGDTLMLGRAAARARDGARDIVVHLPDSCGPEWAGPARSLMEYQREKRAVVHFRPGGKIPDFEGISLGLENCAAGCDTVYYERLFREVERRGTFFAFDLPRLFAREGEDVDRACAFIRNTLTRMGERDFLHLVDQRRTGPGRDLWTPLGEGLLAPLMNRIYGFPGGIVFEFEDLEKALRSRDVLLSGRARR